jgi:hypothetical protein
VPDDGYEGYDGYGQQGYPQQGYQQQGYQQQSGHPQGPYGQGGQAYPQQAYQQPQAHPQDTYSREPYPQEAWPQDPYGGGRQGHPQQGYVQHGYYQQPGHPQDPYGPGGQGGRPQEYQQQAYVQDPYRQQPVQQPPVQQAPVQQAAPPAPPRQRSAAPAAAPARPAGPAGGAHPDADDSYATGEFTFVDEAAEESEDVIDWLKFAESRSEVRAERRRRLRNRLLAVAVVLVLAAGGTGGYLWWSGKLGGGPSAAAAAGGRQVNVVHLRDLQGKVTTALLVDDASGQKATVLLLPDTLRLPASGDAASPTVGTGLDTLGPSGTRDGLATVLGAPVAGTWRLDTPYLTLLVAQLGGITVDTDAEVHSTDGKVTVTAGKGTDLNGQAAALYATYQAPGEGRDAQLARFGQVMAAVIRAMPTDVTDATDDVRRMNAVLDPSLPEKALGGVLAGLAQQAKGGHLDVQTLKAKADGTLDQATAGQQVKTVLGGTVHAATSAATTPRVSVVNASGNEKLAAAVEVQVTNAGLEAVPSSTKSGAVQAASEIRYTDDSRAAAATSLAVTLGLKPGAVKKVSDPQNVDLVVVVGKDFPTQQTP